MRGVGSARPWSRAACIWSRCDRRLDRLRSGSRLPDPGGHSLGLLQLARKPEEGSQPAPVSILKPIRGGDASLRKAIDSHLALTGDFELLCGVRAGDPARTLLTGSRIVECTTQTPNGKVGSLIDLARAAQHSILIANDADIRVEPDYLRRVTAPLKDASVGLVTCLYRAEGDT